MLGDNDLSRPYPTMTEWWVAIRKRTRKGVDSMVMLVSWCLWKLRNDIVFNARTATIGDAIQLIMEDVKDWVQAGPSNLATLGWPRA
ncbi:hypothetical protein HU200_024982 [Digitaria exilis]|uniref:Uncharacterized protein n=1 Tax=Digitaria exilis TaxID=1010633 RepID=A0A835EVK7_9POAL|nr:hypothetical protein HU200_024982 [Digitaria exilis]